MNSDSNTLSLAAVRVPPKLSTSERNNPALLAVGGVAVVVAGLVVFWFNPAQYRFYPFCSFHELTGLHCPGCGGTRALHQLLHGQVATALHLNALLVLSSPLLAWLGVRCAVGKIKRSLAARPVSPKCLWWFLGLAVGFTVLRNLPACAWLAP